MVPTSEDLEYSAMQARLFCCPIGPKQSGAAMSLVREWLASHGLSEYAERFAENRIDFSVLPDLTEQDLKDLGVVLGDRRKMLRAIAELGRLAAAEPPAAVATTPVPAAASPPPISVQEAAGERR